MITLTEAKWQILYMRLRQEHLPSIFLIRDKMRRELGFVIRRHETWINARYGRIIYLDFYDDRLESWFVLKYSEYL